MKLAVISLGSYSSTRILEEAKKHFDDAEHIDIRTLELHITNEGYTVSSQGKPLSSNYDCVYVRGSHKYSLLKTGISKAYHRNAYLPIHPGAFTIAHDKFLTLLQLRAGGVRIPKTYLAATATSAKKILAELEYPIILKTPHGTQGKGVLVADSLMAAKTMVDALEVFKQPYLIQEYIDTNFTDIRALVIGGKVIGMQRKAATEEVRANIHAGGKGTPIELDADVKQLALRSAKLIGAEICAVDILEGLKPAVIEVNLSPGLKGITQATKKNIPQIITSYLAERTSEYLKTKNNEVKPQQPKEGNQYLTALDIKNGMIRLPKFVTDLSQFTMDDEVAIQVGKGVIKIAEHKIAKED